MTDGKKSRIRHNICYLIALLWCAKTGGEREFVEKKRGEKEKSKPRAVVSLFIRGGLSTMPREAEAAASPHRAEAAASPLGARAVGVS